MYNQGLIHDIWTKFPLPFTEKHYRNIDQAIEQFKDWQHERVSTFIVYLNKHRQRMVNYGYYQAEGFLISSGAVESTVKQFGQRMKLAGAQWERDNVPQVFKHCSAYLNGQFSS